MKLAGGAWIVAALVACGPRDSATRVASDSTPVEPRRPADTLVLVTRSGHQIWLAEGRDARDSAGTACYERSVEVRTDSTTIKVPLLFVAASPRESGPGSVTAELSRHCRVMAIYRVDLMTGRPTKVADR